MSSQNSIEELRVKRSRVLLQKEHQRLRERYGEKLAIALSLAAQQPLQLADFKSELQPQFILDWPERIEHAFGLVAAYISKHRASKIADCLEVKLGNSGGLLGFHDKAYLGFFRATRVSVSGMLAAAEAANDSVLFYPESLNGVILLDCYASSPGEPFSVVIQGDPLIELVRDCLTV